jgi:hypothetical protein
VCRYAAGSFGEMGDTWALQTVTTDKGKAAAAAAGTRAEGGASSQVGRCTG